MPRPFKCRLVESLPPADYFKPRGVPLGSLEVVNLTLDEFEAVRLADYEGMYQEKAAERMGVSRQTFGNIVEAARKKIADALVNSKAIRIEGGVYRTAEWGRISCAACGHEWSASPAFPSPETCPKCGAARIVRAASGGRGGGFGRCRWGQSGSGRPESSQGKERKG